MGRAGFFGFRALAAGTISLAIIQGSLGQTTKRTLKLEDYKSWEVLGERSISNDGRWLTYMLGQVDGDPTLIVKNNDEPKVIRVKNGARAQFSDDSKWCAYLTGPGKAEVDKLREAKKPPELKLTLLNLPSGGERVFENISRYLFIKGSKTLLALKAHPGGRPDGGSDLIVVDLVGGSTLTIGNVADAFPNRKGTLVAYTVQSDSGEGGVQLLDPNTFSLKTVYWGKEQIRHVDWAKDTDTLAFLVGKSDETHEGDWNRIFVAHDLNKKPTFEMFDPEGKDGFPKGFRISESRPLQISDDATKVSFGMAPWAEKKKPGKPGEKAFPEVWNSKDIRVVPQQRLTAAADRNRADLAMWKVGSNAVLRVTESDSENAYVLDDFAHAVVLSTKPYESAATNGFGYLDIWVVDTDTGKRTKVVEKTHWNPSASPKSGYLAYFKQRNWWVYNIQKDTHHNLTESIRTTFENTEDDHTVPEKPPAGGPIWLANDAGLLLNDLYDVYLFRSGMPGYTQITDGRKEFLQYRYTEIDIDPEKEGPNINQPMFFSIFNRKTKASGYATYDALGKGKTLAFDNMRISNLRRAKDADRVVFQMESFEKSPNLYITNLAFSAIKPESKTNPQQANFLWGKTELVDYKNRWGVPLQGTLIYPADYVKGRRYPMVTYIYERLSDNFNAYIGPNEASAYNPQVLSQNGYFVFMPDIVYKGRNPGLNAVDCLEPAISAVLAKQVGVDSEKIALMGHSWGAYQTAFVTTVSKTFKVGVAGAPLTELTSMYNTHYWNVGITNQVLLETGQGRLEVPFWEDPKTYIANSPVWQSQKRTAPILITFGNQDGAVDYHQGIALYNTLRRMGKDCVLLIYDGENHNFTKRPDQLDYARRVRHYLDVYLKGAKPEPWISDGVPYIKTQD